MRFVIRISLRWTLSKNRTPARSRWKKFYKLVRSFNWSNLDQFWKFGEPVHQLSIQVGFCRIPLFLFLMPATLWLTALLRITLWFTLFLLPVPPSHPFPFCLHLPRVYIASFLDSLNRQSSSSFFDLHQIDTSKTGSRGSIELSGERTNDT